MGFLADVILWHLEEQKLVHRMQLHKVHRHSQRYRRFRPSRHVCKRSIYHSTIGISSLSAEKTTTRWFIASRSLICAFYSLQVLWDVATGNAICGSPTDGNLMQTVRFLNRSDATVVVAGHSYLSIWDYDRPNNKLRSTEIQLGQLRRVFASVHIDADDAYVYAATTSGDIFQVCLSLGHAEQSPIGRSAKTRIDNIGSIEETHSGRRNVRLRHERWSNLCRMR